MSSHCDSKKKCRVGTMDEKQFYSECEKANAAFFRQLLQAWAKAGGSLKWGAGGVGLRGSVGGKQVGFCFVAPMYAGKKDRIELGCSTLTRQLGEKRCAALQKSVRDAAGDHVLGKSMISIVQPGELSAAGQKALTKVFCGLI